MSVVPDEPFADVATEVEVVRINPNRGQGLVVSAVEGGAVPQLPADRLRPDEDPVDAARRVLRDVVGVSTVHHEPHFLGYRRYADRQQPQPTLTLTFLVLGPIPNDHRSSSFPAVREVIEGRERNQPVIDHPDTVIEARDAAFVLLETTPIALKLLGKKETERFTLKQMLDVYRLILGEETPIDISNFRRKVEAARDFVRPAEPPEMAIVRRGRPARWYTAGEATRLDPPIRFRR
jgi:ADP-ribose pyrophosphatase YjhB (NUDIX family)